MYDVLAACWAALKGKGAAGRIHSAPRSSGCVAELFIWPAVAQVLWLPPARPAPRLLLYFGCQLEESWVADSQTMKGDWKSRIPNHQLWKRRFVASGFHSSFVLRWGGGTESGRLPPSSAKKRCLRRDGLSSRRSEGYETERSAWPEATGRWVDVGLGGRDTAWPSVSLSRGQNSVYLTSIPCAVLSEWCYGDPALLHSTASSPDLAKLDLRLEIREKSVVLRVGGRWQGLLREVGDAPSPETREAGLAGALRSPSRWETALPAAGWARKGPPHPDPSMVLWKSEVFGPLVGFCRCQHWGVPLSWGRVPVPTRCEPSLQAVAAEPTLSGHVGFMAASLPERRSCTGAQRPAERVALALLSSWSLRDSLPASGWTAWLLGSSALGMDSISLWRDGDRCCCLPIQARTGIWAQPWVTLNSWGKCTPATSPIPSTKDAATNPRRRRQPGPGARRSSGRMTLCKVSVTKMRWINSIFLLLPEIFICRSIRPLATKKYSLKAAI